MSAKETLELEIKLLIADAKRNIQAIQGDIKGIAEEARKATPETKAIADAMKRINGEDMRRAAAEAKLFGDSLSTVKRQQAIVREAMIDMVQDGLSPTSAEVQNLIKKYNELDRQTKDIATATGDSIESFDKLKTTIASSASAIALFKVAQKGASLGSFALESADTFQKARNEFGTLLNDMSAGAALFNQIKSFNDVTPFNLETTKQGVNVLLSAEVPIGNLNDKLTMFGDISQGNSQKFTSFINAFAKGAAKGTVDMEVLNVYLDQGVPILAELAKGFDTTKAGVIDMVSKGKVGFDDFSAALSRLTAEGGQYFGGMALGAKDLSAMQEGLSEASTGLAASYGQMLLPAMKNVFGILTETTNAINESPILKGLLAGALVAITGYLAAMAVKQAAVAVKTWLAYAAQMGFNGALAVTNPLLLAGIAAAAAATVAIVAYAANQQNAANATNDHALALKSADQAAQGFNDTLSKMSNGDLGAKVQSSAMELVALERQLADAQREFAKTPTRLTETHDIGGGQTMTYDYGENKRYSELSGIIADLNTQIESTKTKLGQIGGQIDINRINTELAYGNEILAARDSLYQSTTEYQREQLVKQIAFAQSLYEMQTRNKDGTYTGFDIKKTDAILKKLEADLKKLNEKSVAPEFKLQWSEKNLAPLDRIRAEMQKSMDQLNKDALASFGSAYQEEMSYIEEKHNLEKYYANELAKEQRNATLNQHQEKMKAIQEEWNYQRELARQKIEGGDRSASNYASFAMNDAKSQISGTDVGQIMSGADPMTMFITATIKAATELESVNKLLNFVGTFVDAAFDMFGPILDGGAEGLVDVIVEAGHSLGQILSPFLGILAVNLKVFAATLRITQIPMNLLAKGFEWFYNYVIVAIGNGIIGAINAVIGLINKIPGINIKKISQLQVIGELAEEMAKEMERQKEEITKSYERQKARVEDELRAQIGSIQKQYELGLISRDEYNSRADEYTAAADSKIDKLNEEQLAALELIELNTRAALSADQMAAYGDEYQSYADKWGETVPVLGHIAGGIADAAVAVGSAVGNAVQDGLDSIGDWTGWWDVGSYDIPKTQRGTVHPGEIIIPKPFADGIKSNKLSLSGPSGGFESRRTSAGGTVIYVTVDVAGSVIKKNDLIDEIYDGLAEAIEGGRKTPLPRSA